MNKEHMDDRIQLMIFRDEWENVPCDTKVPWESFSPHHKNGMILTCSDEGIFKARQLHLPVIAVRNEFYEKKYGRQELFGTPVLLESLENLDEEIMQLVRCRFYGLPLILGCTSRCRIREICEADIPDLYDKTGGWINEQSLNPVKLEPGEFENFWKAYIQNMYGFFGYGLWMLEALEAGDKEGHVIGLAGFENIDYNFVDLQPPGVQLAYWIAPEMRKRGYAKEVCSYLLENIMADYGWDKVSLFIKEENQPSLNLARRLGFSDAGEFFPRQGKILQLEYCRE